jgi:hypothetical protein
MGDESSIKELEKSAKPAERVRKPSFEESFKKAAVPSKQPRSIAPCQSCPHR